MNKQIEKIDLSAPIIPNHRLGGIELGMNIFYLRKIYKKSHTNWRGEIFEKYNKDFSTEVSAPFLESISLNYKGLIDINVNLFIGRIYQLTVYKGYKGKIWNSIKVGDTIKDILRVHPNSEYWIEEEYFCLKNEPDVLFVIAEYGEHKDYLEDVENEKELLKTKIRGIRIFNKNISAPAIDLEEMPKSWKSL